MSELQTVEEYIHVLKTRIVVWFQKHFGELAPDSEAHKTAAIAHEDLKTIVAATPPATTVAPVSEVPPPTV